MSTRPKKQIEIKTTHAGSLYLDYRPVDVEFSRNVLDGRGKFAVLLTKVLQ